MSNGDEAMSPAEFAKLMGAYPEPSHNPLPAYGGYMDNSPANFAWVNNNDYFGAEDDTFICKRSGKTEYIDRGFLVPNVGMVSEDHMTVADLDAWHKHNASVNPDSYSQEELEEWGLGAEGKKNCGCGQDPCITYGADSEDYVDYTMWLYRKSIPNNDDYGAYFHWEWENEEDEEQVVREWKELLDFAIQDYGDDLIRADLRKHSNYDDQGVSHNQDMLIEYEHGEDDIDDLWWSGSAEDEYESMYSQLENKLMKMIDDGYQPSDIDLEEVVWEVHDPTSDSGSSGIFQMLMNDGAEMLRENETFDADTDLTPTNHMNNSIGQVVPITNPMELPTNLIETEAGGGPEGQITPDTFEAPYGDDVEPHDMDTLAYNGHWFSRDGISEKDLHELGYKTRTAWEKSMEYMRDKEEMWRDSANDIENLLKVKGWNAETFEAESANRYWIKKVSFQGNGNMAYEAGGNPFYPGGLFTSAAAAKRDLQKMLEIAKDLPEVRISIGNQYYSNYQQPLADAVYHWRRFHEGTDHRTTHHGFTVWLPYGVYQITYEAVNKLGAETFEASMGEHGNLRAMIQDPALQKAYKKVNDDLLNDFKHLQTLVEEKDDLIDHYEQHMEENAEVKEAPYGGAGALMDIGKETPLADFTGKELAESSAIHGDFDQASLNYSGHQNLEVRAESEESEGARCMRRLDEMIDSMQEYADEYLARHPVDGYLPSDDHHDYTEVADGMVKDTTDAQQMASEIVLRAMDMRDMADDLDMNIEYDAEMEQLTKTIADVSNRFDESLGQIEVDDIDGDIDEIENVVLKIKDPMGDVVDEVTIDSDMIPDDWDDYYMAEGKIGTGVKLGIAGVVGVMLANLALPHAKKMFNSDTATATQDMLENDPELVENPNTGDLDPAQYEELVVESTGYAVDVIPMGLDGSFMGSRFQALPTERYVEYNEPGIGAHTDIALHRDEIYLEPEQAMVQASENVVKESQAPGQSPYNSITGEENPDFDFRVLKETRTVSLDPAVKPFIPQSMAGYTGNANTPPSVLNKMFNIGVLGQTPLFVAGQGDMGSSHTGSRNAIPDSLGIAGSVGGPLSDQVNANYTDGTTSMSLAQWSIENTVSQTSDTEAVVIDRSSGMMKRIRRV